jgi:hypothetical protein
VFKDWELKKNKMAINWGAKEKLKKFMVEIIHTTDASSWSTT